MTSLAPDASTAGVYRIVSRVHVNEWDDALQAVVPGWRLKAWWLKTGTILPVFVPDQSYGPQTVDTMIRAAGATDEQIHALGG